MTGGARLDHDSRFGAAVSPRLDAVWQLLPSTSAKLLAGSAFRSPTHFEDDVAGIRLEPERVRTYEAALERGWGGATATLSAYHTELRDRIDLIDVDSLGFSYYRNRGAVDSRGLEAELRILTARGTRVRASLARQHSREGRVEITNSPEWNGQLLVVHAPDDARFSVAGGVRWLSSRVTRSGAGTGGTVVADARLGLRVASALGLGFEARNLFDGRAVDPASDAVASDRLPQEPRTLFVTLTWRRELAR